VAAQFSGLDGTADDYGIGAYAAYERSGAWLGQQRWVAGVLWQRMKLTDYRFDYEVTEGPQAGTTGTIDFDNTYEHLVPFIGLSFPREYTRWSTDLHGLATWPMPRRGFVGHITGPGFDIQGDTADVGEGKHFGDPSLTFGYSVTYRPLGLSIDVGALLSQAVLEPRIHRGIDQSLVVSFSMALPRGE
jgi:hypothetical protein